MVSDVMRHFRGWLWCAGLERTAIRGGPYDAGGSLAGRRVHGGIGGPAEKAHAAHRAGPSAWLSYERGLASHTKGTVPKSGYDSVVTMHIILIGPQGSGKGTQGERLAAITGAKHLATGDLVRAEIGSKTPLGLTIKQYNDSGELVPDDIMLRLVQPALANTESWILDGYPRDEAQAKALDEMLAGVGVQLDRVIVLDAPDDALIARLRGRVQSRATGITYHTHFNPPPPTDPGPFQRRADDTPEDIRRRLEIYHTETRPLSHYYGERGLLTEIVADQPMDAVTDAIMRALHVCSSEGAARAT
ncbi:MAG: hypothetical protein PVSMB7_26160 [Chloroflexota bacterium]